MLPDFWKGVTIISFAFSTIRENTDGESRSCHETLGFSSTGSSAICGDEGSRGGLDTVSGL